MPDTEHSDLVRLVSRSGLTMRVNSDTRVVGALREIPSLVDAALGRLL